ncbi:MAG: LOG family protein [Acidobacteria bacterium]|nr:LOG family protein [Acidobacteriota bacterium]
MTRRRVTVFGSSRPVAGTPGYEQAYQIGRIIAEHQWELVNGGYSGTMEASARGAREAGGQVTGITVQTFTYARPNPFLTREISTATLFERLETLIRWGDLYVVLPGGTGTLVELGLVWEFCHKSAAVKPILVDNFWQPLFQLLAEEVPSVPLLAAGRPLEPTPALSTDLPRDLVRVLAVRTGP